MKRNTKVIAFIKENADKGYDWLSKELNYTMASLYQICSRNNIKIKKKPMSNYKYKPEIMDFIKNNADEGYRWIWKHLKEDYDFHVTFTALQGICKKYHIKIKDIKTKYRPEIIQFIKDNSDKGYEYILNELNTTYNLNTKLKVLRTVCEKNNIKIKYQTKWTDEVLNFLKEHTDKTYAWNLIEIKNKFGVETTYDSLLNKCEQHNIKCVHAQRLSEGTEVTHVTGLSYIKVGTSLIKKARYIWEQTYGPIPKGHSVIHLDGNRSNCELTNLRCVSRSVLGKLSHIYGYGIITDAMIEILKLEEDINNAINN